MERGNQSIPINPPNKAIERKLRAVHGSCLRLPMATFGGTLIAGVRFLSDEKPDSKGHLQSIGTAHENDCSPRQKARR